ncbi:MAG: helix-turn-helix domain-containing protein [Oscillospiraceae bacterium]|nr:helix-turn-helix domain-containing protein [Oscillospiraceae bacterium]
MRRANLQAERARKGMTSTEMAEALGISRTAYSHWENSDCGISFINVKKLIKLFNTTDFDYLLETTD